MAAFQWDLHDIVDTNRYPIHDIDSELMQQVLKVCHDKLKDDGSCVIPGFIKNSIIKKMCAEVSNLSDPYTRDIPILAFQNRMHGRSAPAGCSDFHPYKKTWPQKVHAVAYDQIPSTCMLMQVYKSELVKKFLAKIVQLPVLYEYQDEFQALNVMYMPEGGARAWHYDGSDFVVTLSLQKADGGGEFEFAPFIRGFGPINEHQQVEDEHLNDIEALWNGTYTGRVHHLVASPGDLVVFNGMRSLHHVKTVKGFTTRINAVMSYDTKAPEKQVYGREATNVSLYGDRVKKIYEDRKKTEQH